MEYLIADEIDALAMDDPIIAFPGYSLDILFLLVGQQTEVRKKFRPYRLDRLRQNASVGPNQNHVVGIADETGDAKLLFDVMIQAIEIEIGQYLRVTCSRHLIPDGI